MKRRKSEEKKKKKRAIYRNLFYNQYDCVKDPVTKLVRHQREWKREGKKKNKAAEKRNRDDGGKKRTSC